MLKSKIITASLSLIAFTIAYPIPTYAGQWQEAGPTLKYLKDDGSAAISQWIIDNGQWYHFDNNGILETGWIMDDEKYYFLGAGGAMYVNRMTPTGFYLGADGAWIKDYAPSSSDDENTSGSANSSNDSTNGSGNTSSDDGGIHELESGQTDGPK